MICLSLQPERQEKGAKPSFHLGSIYLDSVGAACTVKQAVIFVMDFAQRSTLHFKLGYNVEGAWLRGLDGHADWLCCGLCHSVTGSMWGMVWDDNIVLRGNV